MSEASASSIVTIALDAMGGDFGPESVIPGADIVRRKGSSVRFLIFGDEGKIESLLLSYPDLRAVSDIIHTDKMVQNDDKPSAALRSSKGTSMRLAIEAVKEGRAAAVVSSGNTGALMAMAKMILKTVPGIHRPAIASLFPSMGGGTVMLDLGANITLDAENLVQFAVLGCLFAKAHKGVSMPGVGLLNIGTEENKGPEHIRRASEILSNIDFPGRYQGFVEGTDITCGSVDVIVSDGYAGNIALKAGEGVGRLAGHYFKEAMKSDPLAMIGGLFSYFALKRLKAKLDPRLYNGGIFLGLNGLCVKSHGGSDALGFSTAVLLALELAQHDYIGTVTKEINHLIEQDTFLSQGA